MSFLQRRCSHFIPRLSCFANLRIQPSLNARKVLRERSVPIRNLSDFSLSWVRGQTQFELATNNGLYRPSVV